MLKASIAGAARTVFHGLGAIHLARKTCQKDFRILMYHNFPPDTAGLRAHCKHIRRYYHPVSMSDIADSLATGRPLPENAVAITVDDGYRDFLLYAHPCFQEFGIPATVFLVSEFLDGNIWLWWNRVEYAIANSRDSHISVGLPELAESLKLLPDAERRAAVERIVESSGVSMPSQLPEQWQPLQWEEVRQLSRQNVEFGGHTRTHPILSMVSDPSDLQAEIQGCKTRIEEELGAPVQHFCYPNGRGQDIGDEAVRLTRAAGYRTSVTTEWGMNRLGDADAFLLRRLPVTPEVPKYQFAELLAGSPFARIRGALRAGK